MNKRTAIAALAFAAATVLPGCRQRDIRHADIRVPQATVPAIQEEIRAEIAKIDGVDAENATFEAGVLSVDYDSMKLGLKNIEHAIKDIGYDANDFKGEPKSSLRR